MEGSYAPTFASSPRLTILGGFVSSLLFFFLIIISIYAYINNSFSYDAEYIVGNVRAEVKWAEGTYIHNHNHHL